MHKTDYFKQIKYIYWGIFAALVLFFMLAIFLVAKNNALLQWTIQDIEKLKSIIILLALGGIPASFIFHNKKVRKIDPKLPTDKKIRQYRDSFFIKIATFEGLGILALIGYLASADKTFIMIFGLLFVAFLLNVPIQNKILEEISKEENPEQSD